MDQIFNPCSLVRSIMVFFILMGYNPELSTQPQSILLLDDFEKFPLNSLDNETAVFDTLATITRQIKRDCEAYGRSGKTLKLSYDVSPDLGSAAGMVSFLPLIDLSGYRYLSFRVRGGAGNEFFQLELKRLNGQSAKISPWNYLPCGVTTEWQKVVIPLDAFWNLTERTDLTQLVIVFDQYSSTANGSPLKSEICFDDFLVGTFFPGSLRIDPFSDKFPTNATGANSGSFSPSGSETNYTSQVDCSGEGFGNCNCCNLLRYNHNQGDDFGGAFVILGGGADGWTPIPKNLSEYDMLFLEATAVSSNTNPGNFKVELKGLDTYKELVPGISTNTQVYELPFAGFTPPVNPDGIKEFTVVFEKNVQDIPVGRVCVDQIEFRAAGYVFPDPEQPGAPQNVAVNGMATDQVISLDPDSPVSVSALVNNAKSRLESVRLEYLEDFGWAVLERKYAPFNSSNVVFSFSSDQLPQFRKLKLRLVAEFYNDKSDATPPFELLVGEEGADINPTALFRQSFELFRYLRAETGVYTDAARFEGAQFHPASVATTGMGLIALCIADQMDWIDDAEEQVLETLKSMNGLRPGFKPERNCTGWFRHFIWQDTGARAWDSEFSSIDSGILTAGALFCKKYFAGNDSIALLADALYLSIDWESTIADPVTGGIYLTSDSLGQGGGVTLPFNEYMIVAWLAKNDFRQTGQAADLWAQHFQNPVNFPKKNYMGIDVPTDHPSHFLSGFVHQFVYYLCHYYGSNETYLQHFENAMRADTLWWSKNRGTDCMDMVWGFGAGASNEWVSSGYHADEIGNHPGTLSSPHIIAGFIPVNPTGLNDLIRLYRRPLGVYRLPDAQQTPILWRLSWEDPEWLAGDVQGVDFSTLLFGMAAHPDLLGAEFFQTYNDFDFPAAYLVDQPPVIKGLPFSPCNPADNGVYPIWAYVFDLDTPPSRLSWTLVSGAEAAPLAAGQNNCLAGLVVPDTVPNPNSVFVSVADPAGGQDNWTACQITRSEEKILETVTLGQNYPNPLTDHTVIPFYLDAPETLELILFSTDGTPVYRHAFGRLPQGSYRWEWNRKDGSGKILPAGVYFYRLQNNRGHYRTGEMMAARPGPK